MIQIKKNSLHYRYFSFLERVKVELNKVFFFPQNDPFSHYVFFNCVGWSKSFCDKYKITEYNFRFFENFPEVFKLLIKRILLFLFFPFLAVPVFISGILSVILNTLKTLKIAFKNENNLYAELPKYFISYLLLLLFRPLIFTFLIFLEIFTKFSISLIYFFANWVASFAELTWLFIFFTIMIIFGIALGIYKFFTLIFKFLRTLGRPIEKMVFTKIK